MWSDLGRGDGAPLRRLIADPTFAEIVGVDVSHRALEVAARRIRMESMPDRQRDRISLLQSSLTYRDDRLGGFDAAVLMEVIEHVDPYRLEALQRNVFGHARPNTVVVTTPNAEYNVRYPDLPADGFRHRDHRFEWSRVQFREWADAAAITHGYDVQYRSIGPVDPQLGSPTQLALFGRTDSA